MGDQRYPLNITFIGVIHKDAKDMFMTSVLWSDHCNITVYRSFREFKQLHRQLKKLFTQDNPFRRSKRVIPRFRGRIVKKNLLNKVPKSMARLKLLEKYCEELFRCDPNVIQSSALIQFFLPNNHDLQPEIAKNSILIMPSEDMLKSKSDMENVGEQSVVNVTRPFVTETYRCVASYETKDTKNRPFKVSVDDTVDVLIKDKGGWWLVENNDKCMAWFPAPYLEKCEEEEEEEEEEDDMDNLSEKGVFFRAIKNYTKTHVDELSVNIGAVVEVLQRSDTGWWLVRYNGKAGYVPSMYLQPYKNPHLPFLAIQKDILDSKGKSSQLTVPSRSLVSARSLEQISQPWSSSPVGALQPKHRHMSRSTSGLSEGSLKVSAPVITVWGPQDSKGSSTGSTSSDGSEFNFSDEGSQYSSRIDLGELEIPVATEHRRHSDIGPLTVQEQTKLMACNSEPKLFKAPTKPTVPPRPQAQEILTRCSTITKRAALSPKVLLSPQQDCQ